jgi:predicted DNA-binding transcriptional regulator AlpA
MRKRLRYADLKALGIVNNRPTLANWIKDRGFPRGQLTGPNSRTWDEDEVQRWLDNRPTAPKPAPSLKEGSRRGRPRKTESARADAQRAEVA